MKYFIITLLTVTNVLVANGQEIRFLSKSGNPVSGVVSIGYNSKADSIGNWKSDADGIIHIQGKPLTYLVASHSGFNSRMVYMDSLKPGLNDVFLTEATDLKEVVVTAKDVEEFPTHTSYWLSQTQMQNYPDVLQSLNEIPHLTVLTNGAIFYQGDTNIKVLIDGVDATNVEIQSLSKEDISKVNVYQNPPLRFVAQGINAVIDIKLKSKLHGGNGSVNIQQAFHPIKGNNSAAVYYNYRQSRFSLLYDNSNKHYKKYRLNEVLDYEFDGVEYRKEKKGIDSPDDADNNNLTMSYQVNKRDNFLYNIQSGLSFYKFERNSDQKVTSNQETFDAFNYLQTKYTRFNVRNYFEKNFGEDKGTFSINANYQHYNNRYASEYTENHLTEDSFTGSHSKYKTAMDAFFSEAQYEFPVSKLGYFSLAAYETYKHSHYVDTTTPFFQTSNILGGALQWMGFKPNFYWYVTFGFNWYHTGSTLVPKSHNLFLPSPSVNLTFKLHRDFKLIFDCSYTGDRPSIAQLSETNQWLDTRLVYHGNAQLKPYKTAEAGLRAVYDNKYAYASLNGIFESSPNRICDMYASTPQYMLQTFVNLNSYRVWSGQLDLSIYPLGNSKLVFWNRVIASHISGRNTDYKWNGYRFQWMSYISLNLKHWTATAFYQFPGKVAQGQLVRPRAQCWSATVLYRPVTDLSVGVEWFMPFGNGFRESEYTVRNAPVYANMETVIGDMNNMVSVKLSYTFGFGRNKNRAHPKFSNGDDDSGMLTK